MNKDDEPYLLLLLSDSALPTGAFVASAGLESFVKHGFTAGQTSNDVIVNFVRDNLGTYARSALAFASDSHSVTQDVYGGALDVQLALTDLEKIDRLYETMTINNVARRASKSQGVALLTLFTKGFSNAQTSTHTDGSTNPVASLVDTFKLNIRKDEALGHLPVCWGILTAALGMSLERSQYLHLFLHARSLLSAAVRLNILGPYGAQQILLHSVRPMVESEVAKCSHLRTGYSESEGPPLVELVDRPATTWPLGEILAARHDLQHSRIFNS